MVYGQYYRIKIAKITLKWFLRPRTLASALYLTAVACVVATMLMSFSQIFHGHPTTLPSAAQQWSIHFLTETGFHGMNMTNSTEKNGTKVIWTHPELDILHKKPFQFLSQYKNPCWYEPLYTTNVYQNNKYSLLSPNIASTMIRLMTEWSTRLLKDQNAQRLRCLPYFFIIGQPKCGSTDLFRRILYHPDVVSPPIKELHWWSRNRMGKRINYTDIIPLSDYIDMFDQAAIQIERRGDNSKYQIVTGEASVSVMWENDDWWHFPENEGQEEPLYTTGDYIKHILPELKIIIILRNPTERLFSDYLYFNPTANKSVADFHNRVNFSVQLYENCFSNHSIRHCIYNTTIGMASQVRLRVGLYSAYLKDWMKLFPTEQILIVTLKEYSEKILKTMKKVFKFLNLRALTKQQYTEMKRIKRQNKRKFKDQRVGTMLKETQMLLKRFYDPFDDELCKLLGISRETLWETNDTQKNSSHGKNAPIVDDDEI